jgi:polar amino acid transport system ATP-binding protein
MGTRLVAGGLSKAFDGLLILDDVHLAANDGETIAIVGRSGSGKTTLLKCLSLLESPDDGHLVLDGQTYFQNRMPVFEPWEIRREIMLVFQDFNLFPNMTVLENIAFGLTQVRGVSKPRALEQARHYAEILEIGHAIDRYPNAISGGQAQRCALARAILLKPKVLLLDEITSALDPESVATVVRAIKTVRDSDQSGKMVLILVTHLIHFAEGFADSISFMHDGRLLFSLAHEWRRNPLSPRP